DTECVNERRRQGVYARFPRLRARADHSTLLTFLAILEPGFRSESTTSNVTLSPTAKLYVPVFSAVTWQKMSSPVSVVINPNPRWCIHFLTTPFTIATTTTAMPRAASPNDGAQVRRRGFAGARVIDCALNDEENWSWARQGDLGSPRWQTAAGRRGEH